jgi:hypothetical protein
LHLALASGEFEFERVGGRFWRKLEKNEEMTDGKTFTGTRTSHSQLSYLRYRRFLPVGYYHRLARETSLLGTYRNRYCTTLG